MTDNAYATTREQRQEICRRYFQRGSDGRLILNSYRQPLPVVGEERKALCEEFGVTPIALYNIAQATVQAELAELPA